MVKLITVLLSTFITFKVAVLIFILSGMLIDNFITSPKLSVIFTLSLGIVSIIAFFKAISKISEKIIFRIYKKEIFH